MSISSWLLLVSVIGAGEPAWVNRGSGAFPAGTRVFYGVGQATGVKDPSLLRTTADNRARAELAKVFSTYSASLMKDYSSTDTQQVEQAVKTFTAQSQQGAEIVDRYLNGNGIEYSLCRLDLDRAKVLIAEANAVGAVKSYAGQHADKAYDDMTKMLSAFGRGEVARPPPPTSGGNQASTSLPPAKTDGVKQRSGGKPNWVEGEDPSYPWVRFLYAVGFAHERGASESGATAGLAKIFESRVEQVARDFQASYSKNGSGLEIQNSDQLTTVSTNKALNGVRIAEIWTDSKVATVYALAVIDRAVAAAQLRDHIAELDGLARSALDRASSDDKIKQVRALNQALAAVQEREVANADLRIIDAGGVGVASDISSADVYGRLGAAQEALNVGIVVNGTQSDDVRGALAAGLTQMGYAVKEIKNDDDDDDGEARQPNGDFDLIIVGRVRVENAGKIQNGTFEMVRAVADFQLKNVKKNKVIDEYQVQMKEGHKTIQEAQRRAIRELNKVVAQQIGDRFQKYLTHK